MPRPTSLAPPAFYRPRGDALAWCAEREGVFRLRDAAGGIVDSLAVRPGEWVVVERGRGRVEGERAFVAAYEHVPGTERAFAPRAGAVWELREPLEDEAAAAFAAAHVRCERDGVLLCALDLRLAHQASLVERAMDPASRAAHTAALRARRDRLQQRPVFDPAVQADIHLFDLMVSGLEAEDAPERDEGMAPGLTPEDIPGVVEDFSRAAGLDAPPWIGLAQAPGAGVAQVRAMRERLLGGFTEIPLGRVQVAACAHTDAVNPVEAFSRFLRETGEGREIEAPPDLSNLMPGYEARLERVARDGVEFLLVEDFVGSYVYAWPDARLDLEPGPRP